MKNLLRHKKTLYDNDNEGEFYRASAQIRCMNCGYSITLKFGSCNSISVLSEDCRLTYVKEVKGVKSTHVGDSVFYKFEYLPLHSADIFCENCKTKYKLIMGMGEFQPSRYMMILGGVFEMAE